MKRLFGGASHEAPTEEFPVTHTEEDWRHLLTRRSSACCASTAPNAPAAAR